MRCRMRRSRLWIARRIKFGVDLRGSAFQNPIMGLIKFSIYSLLLLASITGVFGQTPSNDDFSGPTILPAALPTSTGGTTVSATAELDEPNHAFGFGGNVASNSVWYSWTPNFDGFVAVEVSNATFDSVLGVYEGEAIDALTEVGSADAFFVGDESAVIEVQSGTEYLIAVDGFLSPSTGAQSGTFILSIIRETAAANDDFDNPVTLFQDMRINGSTIEASAESGEPDHASISKGNVASNSVWFRWTAPSDGLYGADVRCLFDVVVSVYTGNELDDLVEVGAVDAYVRQAPERALFFATASTEYVIAVDGFSDGATPEAGVFSIEVLAPPVNDNFVDRTRLSSPLPISIVGLRSTHRVSSCLESRNMVLVWVETFPATPSGILGQLEDREPYW